MVDPLAVYLHDHLAGATFAVHLLEDLSRHCSRRRCVSLFSPFACRSGGRSLSPAGADRADWRGNECCERSRRLGREKMGRFKLTVGEPLGTFEAIEALSLGVQGKLALWKRVAGSAVAGQSIRWVKSR